MKVVIQRVTSASVSVEGAVISSIGRGLCVLVGLASTDSNVEVEAMVKRIVSLRLFGDGWKQSVVDVQGEILCVSQFTLLGSTAKGAKPSFHRAMKTEEARELYASFLEKMRKSYIRERVLDGEFAAMMQVSLVNDGPVTIVIDK